MNSCLEFVEKRKEELKTEVASFEKRKPSLSVVQIGNDKASTSYINNKKKFKEDLIMKKIIAKISLIILSCFFFLRITCKLLNPLKSVDLYNCNGALENLVTFKEEECNGNGQMPYKCRKE